MSDSSALGRFEEVAPVWLGEGPTAAPPGVVEDTIFEIASIPQDRGQGASRLPRAARAAHWNLPWEGLAAALAAGMFIVVALPTFAPGGWLSFTAAPATQPPTPTPTAPPLDVGSGIATATIGPGTYRQAALEPAFTFVVPDDMQLQVAPATDEVLPLTDSRDVYPDRISARNGIAILTQYRKWEDVCDPQRGYQSRVPRPPDDVVEWLRDQAGILEVGAAESTTIGGWPAVQVDALGSGCFFSGPNAPMTARRRAFAFDPAAMHRVYVVHHPTQTIAVDVFAVRHGDAWLESTDRLVKSFRFDP